MKRIILVIALSGLLFTTLSPLDLIQMQSIPIERDSMSCDNTGRRVEGYWATSSDPKQDFYKGRYPFPKSHAESWTGKESFIKKLADIESLVSPKGRITQLVYRGPSLSRIDGSIVGNKEFYDTQTGIAWPQGLRQHYFERYNVLPSREFYEYVMNFQEH